MENLQQLSLQLKRDIVDLYKSQLNILEDLHGEHNIMLQKLQDALPNSTFPLLLAVDYFTACRLAIIRKRVLDAGNDTIRKMEEKLKQLTD